MHRLFLLFLLVGWMSCQQNYQLKQAQQIAEDIRQEFAPDKRVALFRIDTIVVNGEKLEIHGETNLPAAKNAFFEKLHQSKIAYVDSLQELPAIELGDKHFGVVNVSVCNMRSEPKHSAELATQALLGASLRVWKREGDFYLVQSPDDYFGWLDDGGFQLMNETELENWQDANKLMVTSDMVFAYEKPEVTSQKTTDLVAGNMVQFLEHQGHFNKIRLPDGRTCFLKNDDAMPLDTWLKTRHPNAENILATAREMMGRPYLWGGTSGKGMDCSGFTKMAYFLNGIQLPRDASQQVNAGEVVKTDTSSLKNLQPGDLLFFGRSATPEKKERITHVAMYLGDGKIIHASDRVKIESLVRGDSNFVEDRLKTFVRSRRMIGMEGKKGVVRLLDSPYYQPKVSIQD